VRTRNPVQKLIATIVRSTVDTHPPRRAITYAIGYPMTRQSAVTSSEVTNVFTITRV
jgi:hypothetical protein